MPDVEGQGGNGVMPFPRVSNAAAAADNADLDPEVAGNSLDGYDRSFHQSAINLKEISFFYCRVHLWEL